MTQLNHRVLIEQPKQGKDAANQPLKGWDPVGHRWADVKVLSGMATISAGAESSVVKASIRFNHATALDASMRITYDGVVWAIQSVLPDASRRYVDCSCQAAK